MRLPSDPAARSCTACCLLFADSAAQVQHCKSAAHRASLRRHLKGLPAKPVKHDEKGRGGDGDGGGEEASSDSSGSESENGSESEEGDEQEKELQEQEKEQHWEEQEAALKTGKPNTSASTSEGTVYWGAFSARDGLQATFRGARGGKWQFSVNSLLLQIPAIEEVATNPWKNLAAVSAELQARPVWVVLILRSGKFAGAVYDGDTVLEHKIFRRYTRRAKAGGAQSAHDKKGGKAQSAGAMMRRAGEEALKADVSKLLQAWRAHLDAASAILVSVPNAMRSILLEEGASSAVLKKGDPRMLSVPFQVRQPTFAEAQVVHARCSSVIFTLMGSEVGRKSVKFDSDSVVTGTSEKADELSDALEHLAVEAARQSEQTRQELWQSRVRERERRREKQAQRLRRQHGEQNQLQLEADFAAQACPLSAALFLHIRAEDTDAVKALLKGLHLIDAPLMRQDSGGSVASAQSFASSTGECEDLQSVLRRPDDLHTLSTPLHYAAEMGCGDICALLLEAGADPGASDARGRGPYTVARDKATRDAFRRSRARLEQSGTFSWEWDAAGVGPGLSEDIEAARREALREKEKEKKRRAKQRKQEQAATDARVQRDDALAKEKYEQEREGVIASTIAAAGECAQCGKGLYKIKAFALSDAKCCSADCVMKLRRRQAADAAERRLTSAK